MLIDELDARAATYTRRYPVGTLCRYHPNGRPGPRVLSAGRTGAGILARVRSQFWVMGHGEIVCQVEGISGAVALSCLQFENL